MEAELEDPDLPQSSVPTGRLLLRQVMWQTGLELTRGWRLPLSQLWLEPTAIITNNNNNALLGVSAGKREGPVIRTGLTLGSRWDSRTGLTIMLEKMG